MSATAISYFDWHTTWMEDIRRRIDLLAEIAAGRDPADWLRGSVEAAKAAWLENLPAKAELIVFNAVERLQVEREWEAQNMIKAIWATA